MKQGWKAERQEGRKVEGRNVEGRKAGLALLHLCDREPRTENREP